MIRTQVVIEVDSVLGKFPSDAANIVGEAVATILEREAELANTLPLDTARKISGDLSLDDLGEISIFVSIDAQGENTVPLPLDVQGGIEGGLEDEHHDAPRHQRTYSVNILLTGDERLRQLNRDYAGDDYVTDPYEREVAMLAIHGTLHLLGYDHATPDEEKTMFGKTAAALSQLFDS